MAQAGWIPADRPPLPAGAARLPQEESWSRARAVQWGACGYLLCMFLYWGVLVGLSERTWLTAAVTYLPRLALLIPAVGLLVASLLMHRKSAWMSLASCFLIAGPIAGFRLPTATAVPNDAPRLRVVSCNVQGFRPNFVEVLSEIDAGRPDVIALQEAPQLHPLLERRYGDWHHVHTEEFWVASRYPVTLIDQFHFEVTERVPAICVRIDTPDGPVDLVNLHFETARRGLVELTPGGLLRGDGISAFSAHQSLRQLESALCRAFAESVRSEEVPLIVAGDFNTPGDSSLFLEMWGGLTNTFDVAGWGYGFTAPNRGPSVWPDGLPWLRIDHILCDPRLIPVSTWTGTSNGSDHRLIGAELAFPR